METINYKFCATRDQARAAAKELNGKFVDLGAGAAKGERWAVQLPVVEAVEVVAPETILSNHDLDKEIALLQASMKAALPECQITIIRKPTETAKNLKGKKVPVYFKKSVQVQHAA